MAESDGVGIFSSERLWPPLVFKSNLAGGTPALSLAPPCTNRLKGVVGVVAVVSCASAGTDDG